MNPPFVRDRFTWLAYFMLSYYAYILAVIGPSVPFIRTELTMNFTVSALYISSFAAGMVIAGFTGAWVIRHVERAALFWGGGLGMALGGIILTVSRSSEMGIISIFFMAILGSYLLVVVQSALSDLHGNNRALALTEANVFAVLAASAAPLAISFGESRGLTWRIAIFAGVAFWGLAFIWTRRRITLPAQHRHQEHNPMSSGQSKKLPRAFWSYWFVVFFSVAVEWCIIFWASTYMETVVGLSKEAAATSVSLFTVAQFLGRVIGSWLTRRYSPGRLILTAGAIVLVGFPMFWLGRAPLVNAVGLFICGFGVANLFPLGLSLTSTVGIHNPDAASGLTSMSSGLAILITPQILGILADQLGIQVAYSIVVPLGIAIIVVTLYSNKLAHQLVSNTLARGQV